MALKLRRDAWEQEQPPQQPPPPQAGMQDRVTSAHQTSSRAGVQRDSGSALEATWPRTHTGQSAPTQRSPGAISSVTLVSPASSAPVVLPTALRPSGQGHVGVLVLSAIMVVKESQDAHTTAQAPFAPWRCFRQL